jgi:hypothetical protein
VEAFREGLSDAGFVEGQNVIVEQRWADNQLERLPELAADLLRRQVAVLICNGRAVSVAKVELPPTILARADGLLNEPPGILRAPSDYRRRRPPGASRLCKWRARDRPPTLGELDVAFDAPVVADLVPAGLIAGEAEPSGFLGGAMGCGRAWARK